MKRKIISTSKAPEAIGPYSQAVHLPGQGLVFTAGQIPIDPANGEISGPSIQVQARQALDNLKAVLVAAGSEMTDVVKTTVYLKNMDDFMAMNQIYAEYFPDNPPARSAVEVSRLPRNVLIEIECVAVVRDA